MAEPNYWDLLLRKREPYSVEPTPKPPEPFVPIQTRIMDYLNEWATEGTKQHLQAISAPILDKYNTVDEYNRVMPRERDQLKPGFALSDIDKLSQLTGSFEAGGPKFGVGSVNDVYKDLTRYKKYGRDAIPPEYTDRQSPLWHTINHDALTNRTSIGPEALDARTKETADTILQMYYGEGKGYGKVPQLDPDLSFGGVDQFDLIPLKPGTSGHAYTALKSEQGTKDYYDNIRRFYMPKILSKHGSIPNHSALIAVDPIQKPTDEMMRRLGLAEIIEHESAHGRLIQGRLTEDELPAYDYIRRASEGEGGRRLPSEATSMRTNLPYKGEEFSNNFHEVRNQLIREIHDALAKDPNMVQYQNWDNVRPRDISFQAHDTQFRGDAGGSWDWASNPEEMLASTIGVGRAAPGMVVNPAIREADDTAISRFLRLNQIR